MIIYLEKVTLFELILYALPHNILISIIEMHILNSIIYQFFYYYIITYYLRQKLLIISTKFKQIVSKNNETKITLSVKSLSTKLVGIPTE